MNRRPLRIWLKRWKALTLVIAFLLQIAVFAVLVWLANDWVHGVLSALFQFAVVYGTTRVFRGANEETTARRQWWRMTAKPTAGVVLGVVFALAATYSVRSLATGGTVATHLTSVIEYGVIAWLYFGSSLQLRAMRPVASPPVNT